ncbi:zinc ribbon domain-containing protein [Arsenicicoccus sp. oral taxon 190]|uniref:zinc ribbon domain-containing protein n=1 Tax=Arsenicicoccus sp. oral taxon 190 TaxID=1658671 RepID=UPI00067A2895|nr:C4-type zinc ribbon domain-containing protein [Arsenicicoccus sp. oral taxon 190]AKT52121.1 Zn-ribbon-like protein [Arsenicicoccus sp. oral taxon 190]
MKADASRQWRLLDLAELDTRLDQITHRLRSSDEQRAVDAATRRRADIDTDLVLARTAVSDVDREVRRAEDEVQLVRDRLTRNQSRLDSGQGTAKDLQALQHEIASLQRRQSTLEDQELEVMERAEGHQATLDRLEARAAELEAELAETVSARDALVRTLEAEREQVTGRRGDVAGGVGEDLLALYTTIRESVGGVGAAALRQRRCEGCHMELNQVDLGRIRSAADDQVLRCEECRRILVRTPESGL